MDTEANIVDPDYEITETVKEQIKTREEIEMKNSLERIRSIINREFKKELEFRENQLDLIQQRLSKVTKTLHLLRYCLVTSYYNRSELQFNSTQEELSNVDGQSRIHPAVKKLLGNNLCSVDIRRQKTRNRYLNTTSTEESGQNILKYESIQEEIDANSSESAGTDIVKPTSELDATDTVRNRNISNYCLIIGNISKWMPSEVSEDNSTHKWMMYVRGPKELPDISHIVQKVVFYLHPSYKPNDIVEITQSPFHLSRRGWGEFPLRVQLYFHCKLNKPVDIIHNLKLDRTYTGRQTLGNETVIKLSLYDDEAHSTADKHFNISPVVKGDVDFETLNDETDIIDHSPKPEENQLFDNLKDSATQNNLNSSSMEIPEQKFESCTYLKAVNLDHSYYRTNLHTKNKETSNENNTSENLNVISQLQLQQIIKNLSQFSNVDKVLMNDGKIMFIKKRKQPQQSLLKTSINKKFKVDTDSDSPSFVLNYDKYKIDVPGCKFRCIPEALPFLFKRLPLINELSEDLDYKSLYRFTAKSMDEFSSWNVGKRFASEWGQARTIKRLLVSSNVYGNSNWTTKKIVLYARSHGYTPLCNYDIFNKYAGQADDSDDDYVGKNLVEPNEVCFETDTPVDVEDCDIENESKKLLTSFTDSNLELPCSFVKQTALDVGVLLKHEEIIPGVLFNSTERVLLQSAMCLADNVIRNAQASLVKKGSFNENVDTISVDDIIQVLKKRSDFDQILSFNKDKFKY